MQRNKFAIIIVYIHWLVVLLILFSFFSIETRSFFGKACLYHDLMKNSHFYAGVCILFLTILRLGIKPFASFLSVSVKIDKFHIYIEKIAHWCLYVWLIVMPVLGWLILSAKGSGIPFGLPHLMAPTSKGVIIILEQIHEILAYIGLFIIFIHASGALYSHYILDRKSFKKMSLKF
ncbi:cytochrome b [Francisella frigiditurris]|uniref:Prokaryotic cytochrome b561 family protein n=1 Tax=Francisella frigiditurris TaxID=1542390 RepID=A0A1J0KSY2_9GAMM|nr:cytochrome b/b6 domain-containing protein [Francisella frigiditurris]APC96865.1 prokaryotic cytochrome b561 family protein [Francisella frigiditurris]